MVLIVSDGKVSYRPTLKNETFCKFYVGGKCKATTLSNCKGCRFCEPIEHTKSELLKERLLKAVENEEKVENISNERLCRIKELELECAELSIKCARLEKKIVLLEGK